MGKRLPSWASTKCVGEHGVVYLGNCVWRSALGYSYGASVVSSVGLLSLEPKKIDGGCFRSMSADCEICTSVVRVFTIRAKHPTVNHGNVKSPLILPKGEISLYADDHDSRA